MTTIQDRIEIMLRLITAALCAFTFTTQSQATDWHPLLDAQASEWETYLGYPNPETPVEGIPRNAAGEYTEPVGYNRNERGVFSVELVDGEPVLRISGEIYGGIFTRQEYENYHLRLQMKWGNKKWPPRKELALDSGILYHAVGEHGVDYWRAWPRSQEFQIIQRSDEGTMGDWWKIADSQIDISCRRPAAGAPFRYSPGAPPVTFGGDKGADITCRASHDNERPHGEWNTLELIAYGDKSLHIVNGQMVMALGGSAYAANGKVHPLTRGRILLQSEAGEVFYRRIEIRPIDAIPTAYQQYF